MKTERYLVETTVWLYPGDNPWHFVTIPKEQAQIIAREYVWPRRGFGAIPVEATIGKTTWRTSMFPDKGGDYLLPIKKQVRASEGIGEGANIHLGIAVIV